MMKPKVNRKGNKHKVSNYDSCQTPPYALVPLLPYVHKDWIVWESARGDGRLVRALKNSGYKRLISTDLKPDGVDFFLWKPRVWDVSITNPPYSVKYHWLKRCYELGKPFALLMPVEMVGAKTSQNLFNRFGIQIIFMDKRIDFRMPKLKWSGNGSQFPTAWYTWKLNLPKDMLFVEIDKPPRKMYQELYG